jgi:hypothetical protein
LQNKKVIEEGLGSLVGSYHNVLSQKRRKQPIWIFMDAEVRILRDWAFFSQTNEVK